MVDNSVISTRKKCFINVISVLNCTATMYVTVWKVYDSTFLQFLFPFSDLFNWLMRNFDILRIWAESNCPFVHKETSIIPASLDFIRLNIYHLIKAMHLFYFFGFFLFIYLLAYLFFEATVLSQNHWIFTSLALLHILIDLFLSRKARQWSTSFFYKEMFFHRVAWV